MNDRLIAGAGDKLALLRHFTQQDFETGFSFFDPDGRYARDILDSIPPKYTEDVCYLDPSDEVNVATFNVLENVKDKARLVEDLVVFFDLMFPAGDTTLTRLYSNTALKAILTILLDNTDVSLSSVLEFLSDENFRQTCLDHCTNAHALKMWERTAGWDKSFRNSAFALIEAKLDNLLLSPVLSRTLDKGNGFYPTKTKILIADLSRARIGDFASKLLGTLLISRATTPVYINDFGFFASDQLASLFSQGGYTVVLDFLSELPTRKVEQTLLSFPEKYVYRTTPQDAEKLQPYISGVENPNILLNLSPKEFRPEVKLDPPLATGRFKVVRKRSIASHTRPATLPPEEPKREEGGW